MDLLTGLAIGAAGAAAGLINTVVGSGTLVTFPTLLALGYPPVTANVSNNIGLVVGGFTGAWGYRRELAGRRALVLRLLPLSAAGGVAGALLLLVLPESAFEAIVPVLIGLSVLLVLTQPRIAARVAARRARTAVRGPAPAGADPADAAQVDAERLDAGRLDAEPVVVSSAAGDRPPGTPAPPGRGAFAVLSAGILLAGMYGGYFGAAQGVLLIGLIGSVLLTEPLQTVNAVKNLLAALVNGVAAVTFLIAAPENVDLAVVLLIAVGSTVGALAGAAVGRRLPPPVLRAVVAVVGVVAVARLVTS